MNMSPERIRITRILEESGETLRSNERTFYQQQTDDEMQAAWDSLKEVPFQGDQLEQQAVQENQAEEMDEEEMSM